MTLWLDVPRSESESHLSRSRYPCLSVGLPGAIASPIRASEGEWSATSAGMLLSAGLAVPRRVFGHGFLTAGGLKMGKSMGNVVDPLVLPPPSPRGATAQRSLAACLHGGRKVLGMWAAMTRLLICPLSQSRVRGMDRVCPSATWCHASSPAAGLVQARCQTAGLVQARCQTDQWQSACAEIDSSRAITRMLLCIPCIIQLSSSQAAMLSLPASLACSGAFSCNR